MTVAADLRGVQQALADCDGVIVACSGGIDSLLLATIAHRHDPSRTVVAHTVTPAVPDEGTRRVTDHARREGWSLQIVRSREFEDERYLANPTDRCYFCKSNLYDAIDEVAAHLDADDSATIISGANVDDLGEYRPGLVAADEHAVRHPYIEAGVGKQQIRAIARHLGLAESELPASPCLASRLYTGTRVTAARLSAVHAGETVLRDAGFEIVRCRRREDVVVIEVPAADRARIDQSMIDRVFAAIRAVDADAVGVELDTRPYRPGQAIIPVS